MGCSHARKSGVESLISSTEAKVSNAYTGVRTSEAEALRRAFGMALFSKAHQNSAASPLSTSWPAPGSIKLTVSSLLVRKFPLCKDMEPGRRTWFSVGLRMRWMRSINSVHPARLQPHFTQVVSAELQHCCSSWSSIMSLYSLTGQLLSAVPLRGIMMP